MGKLAGRLLSLPHAKQVSHHELVFTEERERGSSVPTGSGRQEKGLCAHARQMAPRTQTSRVPRTEARGPARSAPTCYRGGRAIGELMYADWVTQDLLETILKYKDIRGF